ncbi:hypothetical protein HKK72_38790, partial [Actinomadura sp. HBU206391]|nr:hypothetical protein [Actinomadura sp. HBU206391]
MSRPARLSHLRSATGRAADRGEGPAGYLTVVLLVAAIIAGVGFSGVPALVAGHLETAV